MRCFTKPVSGYRNVTDSEGSTWHGESTDEEQTFPNCTLRCLWNAGLDSAQPALRLKVDKGVRSIVWVRSMAICTNATVEFNEMPNSQRKCFVTVYTTKQMACLHYDHIHDEQTISSTKVSANIKAKVISRQQVLPIHCSAIQSKLIDRMEVSWKKQMDAFESYSQLLQSCGQNVEILIV